MKRVTIHVAANQIPKLQYDSDNVYWLEILAINGRWSDEGVNAEEYADSRMRQLEEMGVTYTVTRNMDCFQ